MKHKKGALLYSPILVVFMVFGLIYAWSEITARYKETNEKIGERQFDILNTYHLGETYMFYIDQSAKYSAYQEVYDLAKSGGCRDEDKYEGYNLWTIDNSGQCPPSIETSKENFLEFFIYRLGSYLSEYIPPGAIYDISEMYDLSFDGNNINGTAKLPIEIPIDSTKSPGTYTIYPSFSVNLENYDFLDYDELRERSSKVIDTCENRAPFKCVIETDSIELFNVDADVNSPSTSNLALNTCPDGRGEIERINDYIWDSDFTIRSSIYGFCVESDNPLVYAYEEGDPNVDNSETLGLKDIPYRFALSFEDLDCTLENHPDLDNTDCKTFTCNNYYSCQDVTPLCYCVPSTPGNSCQGDCLPYCSVGGGSSLVPDDDIPGPTRCNQFSCNNYGNYFYNTVSETVEILECGDVDPIDTCACPADDASLVNACAGTGCGSLDCEKDVEYEATYGLSTRCLDKPCFRFGNCGNAPCACNTAPILPLNPLFPLDPPDLYNPSNRLHGCQGECYCHEPPEEGEDTGECDDARLDGIDCHWSEVPQKLEYDPPTCGITTYRCDSRADCPCVADVECSQLGPNFGCGLFDSCNVACPCTPDPVPPPPSLSSCKDRCGDYTIGATCQCDSICSTFPDCCPDISEFNCFQYTEDE